MAKDGNERQWNYQHINIEKVLVWCPLLRLKCLINFDVKQSSKSTLQMINMNHFVIKSSRNLPMKKNHWKNTLIKKQNSIQTKNVKLKSGQVVIKKREATKREAISCIEVKPIFVNILWACINKLYLAGPNFDQIPIDRRYCRQHFRSTYFFQSHEFKKPLLYNVELDGYMVWLTRHR